MPVTEHEGRSATDARKHVVVVAGRVPRDGESAAHRFLLFGDHEALLGRFVPNLTRFAAVGEHGLGVDEDPRPSREHFATVGAARRSEELAKAVKFNELVVHC